MKKCILFGVAIILCVILLGGVAAFVAVSSGKKAVQEAETALRFGAIGDFEYGGRDKVGNKLPRLAKTELEKVVKIYNEEFRPVFVVEMGDMVESSGVKRSKALDQFRTIDTIFRTLDARTEYVLGNHDLRSLSKEEVRGVLGMEDNHRYFDEGAWRFVIMDTNFDKSRDGAHMGPNHYVFGFVPESEYVWLEEALDTDRPTVVFMHHPPIPGEKNLRGYKEVRSFFARYPNVVLTVSGHDPSFRFFEEDGFSSLVVDNLANKYSIGSFAVLDAWYNPLTRKVRIRIEHFGPTRETRDVIRMIPGERAWWVDTLEKYSLLEE